MLQDETVSQVPPNPLSVAPMMQVTDRHFRVMMRAITRRTLLYTEMISAKRLLRGDAADLLHFHEVEHPVALQIGGDVPQELATAARLGADRGYDEIDLNVGCPSPKVTAGNFGASLMKDPQRVHDCVAAIVEAVDVPVTVKHRIGVDDLDGYEDMLAFVDAVAPAGPSRFTVHARKAWLKGLSPKENREVPPLRYDDVHRLKRERPDLFIVINGGFRDFDAVDEQLRSVDGVMIGRAAGDDPYLFATADSRLYGDEDPARSRHGMVEALLPYAEQILADGHTLDRLSRHLLGLFRGLRGGRAWRSYISDRDYLPWAGPEVLEKALTLVPREDAGP